MDADYRSSLVRRLRAVHSLYHDACATMTLEQVNEVVAPTTLPIAFSLVHQVLIEDGSLVFAGGSAPLFNETWSRRMSLAVADHGKERSVEEMMHQRVGDFDELKAFQRLVFGATESYVEQLEPERFNDVVVRPPTARPWRTRSQLASVPRRASRAVTRSNAGSISTRCATSARSNTPGPSWV